MTLSETWLYGSVARGSNDETSDLDVLLLSDDQLPLGDSTKAILSRLPQSEHLSVRHYNWDQVDQMAAYGSLFLLHLKMEGRLISRSGEEKGLSTRLTQLPPYLHRRRDILGFAAALYDVEASLNDDGDPAFELSVLATIIRHCSILACYLVHNPQFARSVSIPTAFTEVGMTEAADEALALYRFRMRQSRGILTGSIATHELARYWLRTTDEFVRRVGVIRG